MSMKLQQKNSEFISHSKNLISSNFILSSADAWNVDKEKRFNLDKLNFSFHESVPILEYLDWKITAVERGYTETVLPLNVQSSNQHITHQAALMLLSARRSPLAG